MTTEFDDAVVGAGIVGLAFAYTLAKHGRRVVVIERSERAQGASIRNFGMIWPIGQPRGRRQNLALRSRAIWGEVLHEANIWHEAVGSLHLAYETDEADVLREFLEHERGELVDCEWLEPARVFAKSPHVVKDGLKGGLWSPYELCVDPREVIAKLPGWLASTHGVQFQFGSTVTGYDRPVVRTSAGNLLAERLWVCSGDDVVALYPRTFEDSGLRRCKLQMMRTEPLSEGVRLGPMLAAGSTLRHYASFERCPSLAAVRARFSRDYPAFDRYGIHVMASQNGLGEIVLGDSHEYGEAIEPFDKTEIDILVLSYLLRFLDIPTLRVQSRWHGTYLKGRDHAFVARPEPGVTIVTGFGGAGMTLSFGVADELVGLSRRPPHPALVVFDIAGTTVEDPGAVNRCFREAFEANGRRAEPAVVDAVMGLAKPLAIRMLLERQGENANDVLVDAIHREFVERMKRFYATSSDVREVAGIRELFHELRQRGIKVALNTGFSREIADVILQRLGWNRNVIDATVTSDEVQRGRPHPDMIGRLQRQLGITDSRSIAKVGDAEADIGEGRNAGCGWTIGVSWGTTRKESLLRFDPDTVVDSVDELRGVLLG